MSSHNIACEDLLIDGYVSHMFGPQDAEAYFSLLTNKSQDMLWEIIIPSEGIFYAPAPSVLESDQHNQEAWAVDYVVKDTDSVVPQHIWTPLRPPDEMRYVHHETLRPPIFFANKDGRALGLSLREAAAGNCMCLRGAEHMAPVGRGSHAQIRVNWCSYQHLEWSEQIMTRKALPPCYETISLDKFAKYVAGRVLKFMETAKSHAYHDDGDSDQRWLIADHRITPHHVILIGAVQVSQASWMPILQLNDGYISVL